MCSASRGSTKRTVMASPLLERSTSEYCRRSSKRRAVMARSENWERRPAPLYAGGAGTNGGLSSPPERLVDFVGDVGGGHADVVEVPLRPFGKLAPHLVALAPDMEGLGQLREKAVSMMIYHRLVGENGHFRLLFLICWR